ncbi:MAG: hypothetical protein ACQGVC_22085 [Myxococcota bacterium]
MTSPRSDVDPAWLRPGEFLDSDHPDLLAFAEKARAGAQGERETAVALFHAVRDGIRYDPYATSRARDDYRASTIARSTANW